MSEQKEKSALELVERAITDICHGYNVSYTFMADIKSAIEQEQGQAVARFAKQCNETAQVELKLRELLKSAIVMRPISELPDKVPDGCMIVAVGKLRVTIKCWVWDPGDNVFPHEGETHFYILPLPKPDRRLHPCYMPGCGKEAVTAQASIGGYYVSCSCGASGPVKDTEEAAKKAWGHEE